jgi:hypothetical protein
MTKEECPEDSITYSCNFDGDVVRSTSTFFCANPGPQSECKSRQAQRIVDFCQSHEKCVEGTESCVEK